MFHWPRKGIVLSEARTSSTTYVSALVELAKLRLTALVVVTTGLGYLIARPEYFDALAFAGTIAGTTLVAVAASALNQIWEVQWDRRMARTEHRPVVTGQISLYGALTISALTGGVGVYLLQRLANNLAASLALVTLVIYVLIYTPLKRRASINTLVGAVPGALPPLIGWAAAKGALDLASLSLFAIMFLWQIPHFLAIGWLYKNDYADGGFRMLAVEDPSGRRSGRMAVLYSLALIPVSMVPALVGLVGAPYVLLAPAVGLILLEPAWRFFRTPNRVHARRLFLASLIHLVTLFAALIVFLNPTPR